MNKKGNLGLIIFFFVLLISILFLGFIAVVGSSVVNYVFDTARPELTNLGVIGSTNMTDVASYTFTQLDNIIQSFTWITGILYIMVLIGSFGIIVVIRQAPSKWLISFYFAMMIILILTSIFISNMYEEFYTGTDDFASIMKEHTILSYMILYSPTIFTVIGFLAGIILFSGIQEESYI